MVTKRCKSGILAAEKTRKKEEKEKRLKNEIKEGEEEEGAGAPHSSPNGKGEVNSKGQGLIGDTGG